MTSILSFEPKNERNPNMTFSLPSGKNRPPGELYRARVHPFANVLNRQNVAHKMMSPRPLREGLALSPNLFLVAVSQKKTVSTPRK